VTEARLGDLAKHLGLPELADRLGPAIESSPDPGRARPLVIDALAAVAAEPAVAAACERVPGEVTRVLALLCGGAPFLVPYLVRHPDWLAELSQDDLRQRRSTGDYSARLTSALRLVALDERADVLRRFKYYELARITVRELSADLVPLERAGETLAEISHLADCLLASALDTASRRLSASVGPARWRGRSGTEMELGFCVLGLGKLGSEELNYSSDVDLIYVHETGDDADETLTDGPAGLSPLEYFTRLAHDFGRLVSEPTAAGFLYRIDLDLRPEGRQGPLVISTRGLTDYYELWAATWEKAAFMKARPVAGDPALGWRVIRAIDPMIYRSAMDLAGVAAIRTLKEKVEQSRAAQPTGSGRDAGGENFFDVKSSPGGIRDVEFVAQALQLLHGGRMPQVRDRSTQRAITSLAQVGVLPPGEADDLLSAYRFLRRTENLIQMEAERQVHRLPSEPAGLQRIGRGMGFLQGDAASSYLRTLGDHRCRIGEIFAALFPEGGREPILALFQRTVPKLIANPASRRMIEDLAERFAREVQAAPNPERAMDNLDRFIRGVGQRRFYYELLLDRPELVARLTALFAASAYFSTYFATHPQLIEPIFNDPDVLLLSRQELKKDLRKIRAQHVRGRDGDVAEVALDALRLFHKRALINVGLLDLAGKITALDAERSLTEIAEVCLEAALAFARSEMKRRGRRSESGRWGEFLVVGMGKLASREITYGSDLDVVFLYDVERAHQSALTEAQEHYVRLAQKLTWALQTRTTEGVCYEIDARLRPSGRQGMLVTSLASLERYHATSAQVWERQALLRARPVAGARKLGRAFERLRRQILKRPLPENLGPEIHRIRLRMESELARETRSRHDFKTGRGGLTDVETVVQYLQLRHANEHDDLLDVDSVGSHLLRLEHYGLLAGEDAGILSDGWRFLQRLSSRLRIVQNRSISDLDEERGDLDALAHQLGYPPSQRDGGARRALLDDYRRHTSAIRSTYLKVLQVE
jgi:glutamate-ammonia-ligase adenylyltransferase